MTLLSRWVAALLLRCGLDVTCVCGHRHSQHDFDFPTVTGFCQSGSWATGCGCMQYEVKGARPAKDRRG